LKGIIVDDDHITVKTLKDRCAAIDEISIVKTFKDKLNAAAYLQSHPIDFMIIDVDLPDSEKLQAFANLKEPPSTIVATNNKHFALQAYEHDFVQDYILKPIDSDRFGKALLRVRDTFLKTRLLNTRPINDDKLFVHMDKKLVKIDVSLILFVEAKGDYITIHTPTKKYTTYSSLAKIAERLKNHQFIDIHRSYIINADKIVDIDQKSVVIGKRVLPISRYKRGKVFQQLNHL